MKTTIIFIILFSLNVHAKSEVDDSSSPAESYIEQAFQSGNLYIAGQPSYEELKDLGSQEIGLVINLRTQREMNNLDFYEDYLLKKADIQYITLPVDGRDAYTPELLEKFAKTFKANSNQKILMHCGSGTRASHLWAAYLVKYKNMEINQALNSVKQYGWWPMPIEKMLDKKLVLKIEEPN